MQKNTTESGWGNHAALGDHIEVQMQKNTTESGWGNHAALGDHIEV